MNEPETLLAAVRYFADLEICDRYMRSINWQKWRGEQLARRYRKEER